MPTDEGLYSVSFCGTGGCFKPGTYRPNSRIIGDPMYKLVSAAKLKIRLADGSVALYSKCSTNPLPQTPKMLNPSVSAKSDAYRETERRLLADFAVIGVEHYEIRGDSPEELNLEMHAKGQGANGMTTAKVKYDFMCQGGGDTYAIRSISSKCMAKMRLPKWYGVDNASPEFKEIWNKYYSALRTHEMGHVLICAKTAKQVKDALESIPSASMCTGISQLADESAEKAVSDMPGKQEQYDADTLHGNK